jgi:archaellum component FlaC
MALIKNAINFGNGFNIGAVGPIDARMRVQYLNDLTSAWTDAIPSYPGMIVTVMYDGTSGTTPLGHVYVLKNADATKLENWVKLSTAADGTISADEVQKNLNDLSDNFSKEVQERQAADTYISGVTSGLVSTLNTYKVKNVNTDDKVLSVDTNGVLSSELSIDYSSTDKKIYLKGINDEVISEIDATDFIKDGMLSGVTLVKEEGKNTQMVFTFNTGDSAQTISLDVEEFLNADEVATLERSLDQHKGDTTLHFTTEEKTKLTNLYTKDALDTKFNEISSALTANTKAHANLSSEITSAKTDISTVSGQVATVSGQVSSISGEVSTVKSNVSAISGEVSTVKSNVSAISGDVKTISDKISENEEVVAEALTDLKANKVSSVVSEEGSNIVVNEVKGENGISYTIGFQWLTF